MVLFALKLMWMCYGFHPINVETLPSLILNHGFDSLKSDFINLQEFERSLSWRNIGP